MRELLTPEQMDNAGDAAKEALNSMIASCKNLGTTPTMIDIRDWWKHWYLLAGHKRLARILMAIK